MLETFCFVLCSLGFFFCFFGIVFNQNSWPPTLWATMLFYTEFIKLKNHTHMKVGHTSGFPFGIYWWTMKNPKNQNFEKMKKKKKKNRWRYISFCICVPKTTTIRGTVPEIWSETDFLVILGLFFAL